MGFLNVDKPIGMTSHDVVARIRRRLTQTTGSKKVGHAGTLDPLASGVLVVCIQQATRLSEYIMHGIKTYEARIRLGVETDTYDAEGEIVSERDATYLQREAVENALMQFTGEIAQVPPMYSAIKQGGRKLYDLARAGQVVEREARTVTIHALDVLAYEPPELSLRVTCSSGTYIRSLAHDLGAALGIGAHLSALRRTRSGTFSIADAVPLNVLLDEADADWLRHCIAPHDALADYPALTITQQQAQILARGQQIPREESTEAELVFAYLPDNRLAAVVQAHGEMWQPHKVFVTVPDTTG